MPKIAPKHVETPKAFSVGQIREKNPSAYAKWTADEEARLVAGFKSGKSVAVLSEVLGRQEGGIRSRLIKLGLIQDK
jgi:ATP-dependent DNA helicase RecQ